MFAKTTATTADTAATSSAAIATTGYSTVMKVFNAVMAANPLGMFLRGLLLVGTALAAGALLLSAYNTHQNRTAELTGDVIAKISVEKAGLNDLFEQIKRTNPESAHRNELIAELNKRYPDLLKNQHLEKMNEEELETARKGANDELERTITLQAVKEGKEKAIKDKSEKDLDLTKVLFASGLSDTEINNFRTSVDNRSREIVSKGQYETGVFSGASKGNISDVFDDAVKANPLIGKKIVNANGNEKIALATVINDYIDASLSSGNDVQILDKFADSKGINKPAATPTPIPTPTQEPSPTSTIGITAVKGAKKAKKDDDVSNGSGASGGRSGARIQSLTINKLVETLIIQSSGPEQTKEKLKVAVTEALLTSVNDFNLSGG